MTLIANRVLLTDFHVKMKNTVALVDAFVYGPLAMSRRVPLYHWICRRLTPLSMFLQSASPRFPASSFSVPCVFYEENGKP
jgi:hypothetical protein